jgi:hypothetical protein
VGGHDLNPGIMTGEVGMASRAVQNLQVCMAEMVAQHVVARTLMQALCVKW